MKKIAGLATAVMVILLAAGEGSAAHPLISDDSGTHGPGKYQLEVNGESGFDRQRQDGAERRSSSRQLAAIISAGLGERVDLVVGLPWQWRREKQDGSLTAAGNGAGDATLELKWRYYEHDGFSLAVKPGVTLPSGDASRGFGSGRVSGGITMIATQELAPLTMHLNASWMHNEFARDNDRQTSRSDIGRVSLAALATLAARLQLAGEVGLERNSDRTSRVWPAFVSGGVIYSLRDDLDLDLGVKRGLTGPATDLSLLAGMSLHF